MIQKYQGHYPYNSTTVNGWQSTAIGVYYCGNIAANGSLKVHYVGRATGNDGMKGRLLRHLREDYWPGVTHFGYSICDTFREAELFEANEIKRLQPKHNTIGK